MDRERIEILLKEYEICHHAIHANAARYWSIFSIFLAINTAVLGGLIYGVVSSDFICKVFEKSQLHYVLTSSSLMIILATGIIFIFIFLSIRVKRTDFIAEINYDRIREIESQLGMWQSWRVHGLGHWDYDKFDDTISKDMQCKLIRYHPLKWWQAWRERYAPPSMRREYNWMLWTLISIWGLVILAAIGAIIRTLLLNLFITGA